jgi:hypothetical protein
MTQNTKQNETKKYLSIGQDILDHNANYLKNLELIRQVKTQNNNTLKLVLNLFLIQVKELKNRPELVQFNKKAILQIVKINIEVKLSKKFQDIIKAIFIYLESNSVLDLKELTVSSFISGMKLLNDDDTIKKYKSNEDLLDTLKDNNDTKKVESAKKLLGL